TAIVHFTLRQRTRLAAMRSRDGVLVLQTLLWPDEVRAAEFPVLDGAATPHKKELAMADTLVDSMSADFRPEEFTDDYQEQLRALLDDMIASGGKKVTVPETDEDSGQDAEVVDLVAALRRSVEAAGGRVGDRDSGTSPKKASRTAKKTTKKAPAKKATAKKAATKKTPAKKTAATKPTARKRA
ncbi:MAG: Ku protein, partial [Rhodococcus sp.]|nr:Ku protein [Rhodococcus sp. (in: high G+C Gram-positive bacteria)]